MTDHRSVPATEVYNSLERPISPLPPNMCHVKQPTSSDASSQSQCQREHRPHQRQGHYTPAPKPASGTGRRRCYCRRKSSLIKLASHFHRAKQQRRLTAVEAARVVDVVGAVTDRAADAGRVAPHHLREVAPRVVVVRVVVRVLCLLLVPAVRRRARKLDPVFVLVGSGAD
jgi:hypothetical protein